MPSLSVTNIAKALDSILVEKINFSEADFSIHGFTVDSREVKSGYAFCAISGSTSNGADYAIQAVNSGATLIICEQPVTSLPETPQLIVNNAYKASGIMAELWLGNPAGKMKSVAITGTNGKTTTAYLIKHIIEAGLLECGLISTVRYFLNSTTSKIADRTTPPAMEYQKLLAEMVEFGTTHFVTEASSHAISQYRLGVNPFQVSIFTNLSGDHLDYHKTMENYYQAKKILFTENNNPDAVFIINSDDEYGEMLANELQSNPPKIITYGTGENANVKITDINLTAKGVTFKLSGTDIDISIQSPLMGYFNVMNLTSGILTCLNLGISPSTIQQAVSTFAGAPGRMQTAISPKGFTAFVDYAHTDDALENVLTTLKQLPHNTLHVVFGCGGDRDKTKRPRMGQVAAKYADNIIVTSDNPRTENPWQILNDITAGISKNIKYRVIEDRREAIKTAVKGCQKGDLLLIAGKGHEDYQDINNVKHHFSDIEEVAEAISQSV